MPPFFVSSKRITINNNGKGVFPLHYSVKKIKKIYFVAIIALLTLMFGVMSAHALEAPASLSVPELVEGLPGEMVEIPVKITSDGRAVGAQLELSYDKALLTYQGFTAVEPGFNAAVNSNFEDKIRVIITSSINQNIPEGNRNLVVLKFQVAAGAAAGQTSPLNLGGVILSDAGGQKIEPVSLSNGNFRVLGTISLLINPKPVDMKVGESVPLTVLADPFDVELEYSSDNTGVAAVDESLKIKGICNGTAIITIKAKKPGYITAVDTVPVNVSPGDINLTVPDALDLTVGGPSKPIGAAVDPSDAALVYTPANPEIVSVDDDGNVTPICDGTTTITVTASKDCYIPVTKNVAVTVNKGVIGLTVPDSIELKVGDSPKPLGVTAVQPGVSIEYASAAPEIAAVDGSGSVTAACYGTTMITVAASKPCYEPVTKNVSVTVLEGQIVLTVPAAIEIKVDDTPLKLETTVDPSDASISFSSSIPSVAEVDQTGLITPRGTGSTEITITAQKQCYGTKTEKVTVTVVCPRLKGDVNGDQLINVQDIVKAIDFSLVRYQPTPAELCASDTNGDGSVNVEDVLAIIQLALSFGQNR